MAEAEFRDAPALTARGLTKRYKNLTAVAGIDLTVARGECVALLGPNGAGKTTTVEMLEGLLAPDSGTIEILGLPLARRRREIMERIGVQLQETSLYKRYTVEETLALFASFYARARQPAAIMDRMALTDKARVQLRKLSGGQRQRVYLGCALINDPDLLFLDEPTTGLDPQARRAMWDLLAGLKAEGKSVLLTTHYMEEAERLADRVAVIDRGVVIAEGTPAGLIADRCGGEVLFAAFAPAVPQADLARVLPWFAAARPRQDGFELTTPDAPARVSELVEATRGLGVSIRALQLRPGTLEDVFLLLTGRSMRDA